MQVLAPFCLPWSRATTSQPLKVVAQSTIILEAMYVLGSTRACSKARILGVLMYALACIERDTWHEPLSMHESL